MGNPISQPVQREDGPRVLSTAQMIMIVRIFPCLEWTQWLYFSAVGLQLAGRLVLSILLGNMMEYDRQLFHGDVGWIATKNPQSCPQYPSIWCRYIDDEAGASPTRKMPVRITLPVCSQPNFTRFIDFGSQCHRQEVSLSQTDVGGFHGWHQSFRPKFCQSCVFWLLDLALHEKPLLVMWFTCNNFGHLQRIKRHFLPVIKRISQPPLLMLRKDPASTGTLHSQVTKSPFWIPQGTSVVGLPSTLAAPFPWCGASTSWWKFRAFFHPPKPVRCLRNPLRGQMLDDSPQSKTGCWF